jgi:hypothetical protein
MSRLISLIVRRERWIVDAVRVTAMGLCSETSETSSFDRSYVTTRTPFRSNIAASCAKALSSPAGLPVR